MSDANPFEEAQRQLEYDIEQLIVDVSLVQGEETRVMIRGMIFEKQRTILELWKQYGIPVKEEE